MEYKFRGLDTKGNWYYGNLAIIEEEYSAIEKGYYISNSYGKPFAYKVRPETVSIWIGLFDKNETMIYEGDVLLHHCDIYGKELEEKSVCTVVFENGNFKFKYKNGYGRPDRLFDTLKFEVTGTIHDKEKP